MKKYLMIGFLFAIVTHCNEETEFSGGETHGKLPKEKIDSENEKMMEAEAVGKPVDKYLEDEGKKSGLDPSDVKSKVLAIDPDKKHILSEANIESIQAKAIIESLANGNPDSEGTLESENQVGTSTADGESNSTIANENEAGSSTPDGEGGSDTASVGDESGSLGNGSADDGPRVLIPFRAGMIGCEGISFSGNSEFDSYDSREGHSPKKNGVTVTYGEEAPVKLSGNASIDGDVITFGANSDIILSGNSSIDGEKGIREIRTTGKIVTSGNSSVSGDIAENVDPLETGNSCDPIGIDALFAKATGSMQLDEGLNLSGNTEKELSAGVYSIESLNVSGNAELLLEDEGDYVFYIGEGGFKVSGHGEIHVGEKTKVTIMVLGEFVISGGGGVSATANPENFFVFSKYETDGIGMNLGGNSDFNAVIYAPRTEIDFSGNTEVRGSVRGKTIKNSGNLTFFYDEALEEIIAIVE